MNQSIAIATLSLTLVHAGCASTRTAASPPVLGGPATRVVAFPSASGEGAPCEATVLVDEPALRLVAIVLRDGTLLPEHRAAVPVTIQAISGAGHVISDGERLRLDPGHAVVLAPDVAHAVEPDPETDLVLLVHHLGEP